MNDSKANLKDTDALVEFQHSLEFFSGAVERVLDATSDYLNDVRAEMNRHIALLEQALETARENERRAKEEKEAAYAAWQQAKDEKDESYAALQEAIEADAWNDDFYGDDLDFDDFLY